MPVPRRQRILVLGALGSVAWLGVQACLSPDTLLCPAHNATHIAGSPCDLYGAAGTPCVAAFSTTRALYRAYTGALYQVTRNSDTTTANIGVLSDGFANAAAQDAFCANTTCTITTLFDQSPNRNDLTVAPPGSNARGAGPGGDDLPAIADSLPVTAGGHKVYGLSISAGMGYRNNAAVGAAKDGQPEGVYMLGSGIHVNDQCCFDFGNAERNNHNNGSGHMDAIRLGCDTSGSPFIALDLENGTYPPLPIPAGMPFLTAMGTNDGQQHYALYWGNAQAQCLVTTGSVPLPNKAYAPMHQEGAILLGIGGDNPNRSVGSFFEGAMTAGVPSNAALVAVQTNIVSAGYTDDTHP
ncbi:MAG TPA: arabinofuranosidase catalytic domain-containing protein [Terracidiphilus sp.]|nr:arabinofuranosidase catalytic domain-containing protein [Terracidiphilus sp.]